MKNIYMHVLISQIAGRAGTVGNGSSHSAQAHECTPVVVLTVKELAFPRLPVRVCVAAVAMHAALTPRALVYGAVGPCICALAVESIVLHVPTVFRTSRERVHALAAHGISTPFAVVRLRPVLQPSSPVALPHPAKALPLALVARTIGKHKLSRATRLRLRRLEVLWARSPARHRATCVHCEANELTQKLLSAAGEGGAANSGTVPVLHRY